MSRDAFFGIEWPSLPCEVATLSDLAFSCCLAGGGKRSDVRDLELEVDREWFAILACEAHSVN
jgi:hypothetical protein